MVSGPCRFLVTCIAARRNLGFSYALLAHISQQARVGDGLSQVPRSQLLRARDSALSAYVNCRGAQPAVVQVREKDRLRARFLDIDFALEYIG